MTLGEMSNRQSAGGHRPHCDAVQQAVTAAGPIDRRNAKNQPVTVAKSATTSTLMTPRCSAEMTAAAFTKTNTGRVPVSKW